MSGLFLGDYTFMRAAIRFRSILSFLLILSIVLLYGCSSRKQRADKANEDINVQGSEQSDSEENEDVPYLNDFESIKQYVDKQVQAFRENKSNHKVRQADYNVSAEGGTIEGYYSDDTLKYIEVHIYGEMGRVSYNVYNIDDALRYFVKTSVQYENPINYEDGSRIAKETREEYLIINGRIYEYTSDLKTLSDTDEANYIELFSEFEKVLENAAVVPASKVEPAKADLNGDDKTLNDLKKDGFNAFENLSFDVDLDTFGKVKLIIGSKEDENSLPKLKLYLADKNNKLVYEFPDFYGNQWPLLYDVSNVSFRDVNDDGLKDVIVIAYYMTGAGEHGAEEFPVAGVYFQGEKEFFIRPELDERINDAGANTDVEAVTGFLAEAGDGTGDTADGTIVPVAFNGLLAGSFYYGKWLDTERTVPKISGNIRYSVYSNFKHIGNGTGSMPYTDEHGRDYISVNMESAVNNDISVAVEIGRTGEVRYVVPREYSKPFYFDTVKGFLGKKIEKNYPEGILQGISADLDNDGKEEHLISVCGYNDADDLGLRGWYREGNNFSYLLLAEETENGFEISVIAEAPRIKADQDSTYNGGIEEGEMMILRSEYRVLGLIDIDDDNYLELVCSEDVHEGTSYYVYDYDNGRYKQVMGVRLA